MPDDARSSGFEADRSSTMADGLADDGVAGRTSVAWSPDEGDGRWDEAPETGPASPGAAFEDQVQRWDAGSPGQERSWGDDPDAAADRLEARVATDPQPTVSPDDPEWTYAGTAVVDDEIRDEPALGTDWLDRICPYLLSEDGTSRSSQPDERHRCTAQDPPATLPLAFQERFCLTERHVRCEMYKVAEDARTQAFADDSIPPEQVRSARFRPTVRSRPVALEPSQAAAADPPKGPTANRQVLVALGAAGAFALVLVVIAMLLGGGGGGGAPPTDATPGTGDPVATIRPGQTPGPVPTTAGVTGATAAPLVTGEPILIRYELQPDERLVRIAEIFGTSRLAIERVNDEFGAELEPRDARVGDVIIVPVSPAMSEAEIQALPGFVEFVESEPGG